MVLVRHGTTVWSREGRHTGRTDVPLSDEGVAEARELGGQLSACSFEMVLTSPLSRAAETCALSGFASRAHVLDDLVEWDYGDFEGMTTAQVRARRPGWTLWQDGAQGGESLAEVAGRADRVVELVRSTPGDSLVFAHGHILRVVCARWIDLHPSHAASFVLVPAALGVLGWERETPAIERWNLPRGRGFSLP